MSEDISCNVSVATASVIIAHPENPYLVMVGSSKKHPKPVIPGGKIELCEGPANSATALVCIERETEEEVGVKLVNPRLIGVATDPTRDVRVVPFSKIKTAVTEPLLPQTTPDDRHIRASYGCPDYIFVGTANAATDSDELKGVHYIDIRTLSIGDLSAGHDVVVLLYRQMLDDGADRLPVGSMENFQEDRARLASLKRVGGIGPSAEPDVLRI
jgi:ADP-ribose pyrophosphatase YjhB (NUDIX family)